MKRVLCYGDSNTWGCSPRDGSRFDENTRWTMVMASVLGGGFLVIEEGLNGRTVLKASPEESASNGIEYIEQVAREVRPVDIAIISLGTNDVFVIDEVRLDEITGGMEKIIDVIRGAHLEAGLEEPKILVVSPAAYNRSVEGSQYYELQINKLEALPDCYRRLCERKNCYFLNGADFVTGSSLDGSHLEAEQHIILGRAIAGFMIERVL